MHFIILYCIILSYFIITIFGFMSLMSACLGNGNDPYTTPNPLPCLPFTATHMASGHSPAAWKRDVPGRARPPLQEAVQDGLVDGVCQLLEQVLRQADLPRLRCPPPGTVMGEGYGEWKPPGQPTAAERASAPWSGWGGGPHPTGKGGGWSTQPPTAHGVCWFPFSPGGGGDTRNRWPRREKTFRRICFHSWCNCSSAPALPRMI